MKLSDFPIVKTMLKEDAEATIEHLPAELTGYKLALSRQTDASEAMSMLEDAEARVMRLQQRVDELKKENEVLTSRISRMKEDIANGLSQLAKIHPSIAEFIVAALAKEE